MRSFTLLSLEPFSCKRDLCHKNFLLPTFFVLTKDALTMWPLYMGSGGKIKIYSCKMYFMIENKVQDCCGQEAFECHMQVAKAVLPATMQETVELLATEEELNRCQTFITNLILERKTLLIRKLGFSLAKLYFNEYFHFFLISTVHQRVDMSGSDLRSQVFLWSRKVGRETGVVVVVHLALVLGSVVKWIFFPQFNSTEPMLQEHRKNCKLKIVQSVNFNFWNYKFFF